MGKEKSLPLVSVVIISYNQGHFIEESLKSVLYQTYKNIEIILVDNYSSDVLSIRYAKSMADKYNVFLMLREDRMLTRALNDSLSIIKGEYVCFIAADDLMIHNKIELQVNYLHNAVDDIAGCFGNQIRIDEQGFLIGCSKIIDYKIFGFEDIFTTRVNLYAPTAMYKTEILKSIGGYNENHKIEDLSMYLQLTSNGFKLLRVKNPLVFYRIHNNNTHTKYKWMMEEKLIIWKEYSNNSLYKSGLDNIYLEHFSNFGSSDKFECIKLIPKVFTKINSKYWWFGFFRLFFDYRKWYK